ncbi:MAG TPA: class I SAM-dependent methyltransferase [Chloroflexota bacterium]|nr:class I SAM-dependent methyltransferase [Chloroflexota bacterium]
MSVLAGALPEIATASPRLERVPCNLCGSWDAAPLYRGTIDLATASLDPQQVYACTSSHYGRYGPVVRCRRCGLVYLYPRLAADAVEAAYEEVADTRYLEEREGRVHTFARALDELEQVRRRVLAGDHARAPAAAPTPRATNGVIHPPALGAARGRLLDVGCHIGVFLELAAARGWAAEGVEPSRWAADVARGRGLRVTCGTLRGSTLPAGAFDVVTMWDVIEHFPDPAAEVREVHRLLRPGGLVGITTMNVDSLVARLLGPRWPWLMQMHLYYFSVRTLRALMERCGFRVVAVSPHRRIVRLSYVLSRTERWSPRLATVLQRAAERVRLADLLVPIDLGDIFTLYAQRIEASNGAVHHGR